MKNNENKVVCGKKEDPKYILLYVKKMSLFLGVFFRNKKEITLANEQ